MEFNRKTLVEGLVFGEAPRWYKGRLWFSDMHAECVMSVGLDGDCEKVVDVPNRPSGLGWLPDGRMLVVSMLDRRLMRLEGGKLVEHADLSQIATWHCNDMVVDAKGNAYVGNFGYDLEVAEPVPTEAKLAFVTADGQARAVADGLIFPNGSVITPDGKTLIVAETFGHKLTAFDIQADGSLSNKRTFADVSPAHLDGICLDAEGGVWIAEPISGECFRVLEGGEITHRFSTDRGCFACMLGGPDRKTLFLMTADDFHRDAVLAARSGKVETVNVEIPGAGLP